MSKLTPLQFTGEFLSWYYDSAVLPEAANLIKLDQLAEKAQEIQMEYIGETVVKMDKNTKKIEKKIGKSKRLVSKYT
jgi:hypothetical protein